MNIFQKRNALIVPQTLHKDFGAGTNNFSHGVLRSNVNDPVYFSHMRDNKPLLNEKLQSIQLSNKSKKLPGKWLYLGGLHNHFGHFIAECIHRIWAWKSYRDQCCGVLFIPQIRQFELNQHLPSYSKEILSLLGLEEDNIQYITELTEVEELVIPEPGSQLFTPASVEYINYLSTLQLGKRLTNQILPDTFSPKVFVSRKKYRMNGSIAGLDTLEDSLQKDGYFIFYPENYSISTQLKVYIEAEKIIFEEGSAVHLLELLDKIKADVLIIKRRKITKTIDCIFQTRAINCIQYDQVVTLPSLSLGKFAGVNDLAVTDIHKLSDFLVDHGFASPSFTIDTDWLDKAKLDIFNYLLKYMNTSSPELSSRTLDYLACVNKNLLQKK